MNWNLVIPFKAADDRKQRLAGAVSKAERVRLTEQWMQHVCRIARPLARVILLSPHASAAGHGWLEDHGRGLNMELALARAVLAPGPFAIIHADLPSLTGEEVQALLDAAASSGCAIAPDRHGNGTNAIAIADNRPFAFHFGTGSLMFHQREAGNACTIVTAAGLACDIDTPTDLAEWRDSPAAAFKF